MSSTTTCVIRGPTVSKNATDMVGPIRRSLLTLEREEHPKTTENGENEELRGPYYEEHQIKTKYSGVKCTKEI
jgi:hypothetical protein